MTARWKSMLLGLCASAVCAMTLPARADEPAAWKWGEGETLHYHYAEDSLTLMAAPKEVSEDSRIQIHFGVQIDCCWRVVSPLTAEHDARLELTIDRMRLYSPSVCYDSKFAGLNQSQVTARAIASIFDPLIGKKWHFTCGVRGRFGYLDGPQSLATVFSTDEAQELKGYYGSLFSSAGFKSRLVFAGVELPSATPTKGASWETDQVIDAPMKDRLTITEVVATEGKHGFTATIEPKLRNKGAQITLSEGSGKCDFDLGAGKLDRLTRTCDFKLSTPWNVEGRHIVTMEINRVPEIETKAKGAASPGK